MIAYMSKEGGADRVRKVLTLAISDGRVSIHAHVMNLCEVYYNYSRQDGVESALEFLEILASDGVQTRADLDTEFWQDAAQIKAEWKRISLADCFGVALARRLDATFLTTDRHELETLADAKVARIEFIR